MEIPNVDVSTFLKMVDTFYNNAWDKLIIVLIVVGGIGGLVGVAWPMLLKKISDHSAKMEVEKLEKNLKDQFQNLSDENAKLIKNRIDKGMNTLSETINKDISKKLDDVDIKINSSRGLIAHVTGNLQFERNKLELALDSYFHAFNYYFYGKSEGNLQTIISCIEKCYKATQDLSLLKKIENSHSNLVKKLNEINENARYSNTIDKVEEEFNSLKKRIKEDNS